MEYFTTYNDISFKYNGVPNVKIYVPVVSTNDFIMVQQLQDSKSILMGPTRYQNISIDGQISDCIEDCMERLNELLLGDRMRVDGVSGTENRSITNTNSEEQNGDGNVNVNVL